MPKYKSRININTHIGKSNFIIYPSRKHSSLKTSEYLLLCGFTWCLMYYYILFLSSTNCPTGCGSDVIPTNGSNGGNRTAISSEPRKCNFTAPHPFLPCKRMRTHGASHRITAFWFDQPDFTLGTWMNIFNLRLGTLQKKWAWSLGTFVPSFGLAFETHFGTATTCFDVRVLLNKS